mgnify:FL=1
MTADKRRIDACLKACEGISTQNLEDNVPFLELARRYNALLRDNTALRAKVEAMEKQGPSVPDDVRKDAERYRFLEHLCATGSYGGIISRKAIDAAMLAVAPEAKP